MGCEADTAWMDNVRDKLIECFAESDPETLTRILFYLDAEERTYAEDPTHAPAWRSLRATLKTEKAFRQYAEKLRDDTITAERDQQYAEFMNRIYSQWLVPSETQLAKGSAQGFQPERMADGKVCKTVALMGFTKAWTVIPRHTQVGIMEFATRFVSNRQLISTVDDVVGVVNKAGGTVVMVGLAAVHMAYEAYQNLTRWWNGEISGARCCKNIIDSFVSVGAGMAGGVGGTMLGAVIAGPIGALFGGVAGSLLSAQVAALLSDRLTQALFGLPKSEALENAYSFFDVEMSASNNEINMKFRQLCLKHHPDKGGSCEKFHEVQVHMGVIKAARGERF